ncbi:MAG: hypothetical protein SVR94_11995, partial [Pseudomonadota bacterium]|nr:hypothetical protein [Pseudomonadota bacterium]
QIDFEECRGRPACLPIILNLGIIRYLGQTHRSAPTRQLNLYRVLEAIPKDNNDTAKVFFINNSPTLLIIKNSEWLTRYSIKKLLK